MGCSKFIWYTLILFEYFEFYLKTINRNGLPYDLISNALPRIQSEINNILSQIVEFQILFDTVNKFVGNLRGGLAITTIITSAIGASITGSSVANAASMCIVAADPMIKMGYKRNFTYGLIAVSGTLGILIPPSIPMLLFASVKK